MFDGIFKLLSLYATLITTLFEIILKSSVWLAKILNNTLTKLTASHVNTDHEFNSKPKPTIETKVQDSEPKPVPSYAEPTPQDGYDSAPPLSSGGRSYSQTKAVLDMADHGIWVAGKDDFITPHPRAEDLLSMLDALMLITGSPYTIPKLDTSSQSSTSLLTSRIDDDFDDVPPRHIPRPDGKLWSIALNQKAIPLPQPRASALAPQVTS
jgi:hypothetical protein